jgi:hypothetical protein
MGMLITVGVVVSVGGEDLLQVTIALAAMAILAWALWRSTPVGDVLASPRTSRAGVVDREAGKGGDPGTTAPAGAADQGRAQVEDQVRPRVQRSRVDVHGRGLFPGPCIRPDGRATSRPAPDASTTWCCSTR